MIKPLSYEDRIKSNVSIFGKTHRYWTPHAVQRHLNVFEVCGGNEVVSLVPHGTDIAALQETRFADSGTLKEKDYTFFWQGKSAEHRREQGVGFAVRNTLLKMVEPGDKGCERLLTLRLYTSNGPISLISAYAPTLTTPEVKDEFYSSLNVVIKNISNNEQVVLLGDFNARVSRR